MRQPTIFVPHGGGPWPFVETGFATAEDVEKLRSFLVHLPESLPASPSALLIVSAHWEQSHPTVMATPRPPMYYDYSGFAPEAYKLQWPAPGAPAIAQRVADLLREAGIPAAQDAQRGFDHGAFVPFKLAWPNADVPALQLSLKAGLDPAEHLAIGRALAPLRDENIPIVGSGMSYHNLRKFFGPEAKRISQVFGAWLEQAATANPSERDAMLCAWTTAPQARVAHPREEHLLPLMVVAGAAGEDVGRTAFSDTWAGVHISAFHYG